MVNRAHEAMKIPYNRVLTALTYIWGPLINDWVDQQEKKLADRINTSKVNWVREDNERLWTEFETAFLAAWTDMSKKQNAYDQLMCHGRIGTLIFILSYLRTRDPARILLYKDRGTFVF